MAEGDVPKNINDHDVVTGFTRPGQRAEFESPAIWLPGQEKKFFVSLRGGLNNRYQGITDGGTLWQNYRVYQWSKLVPEETGWTSITAQAISKNSGLIVATAKKSRDENGNPIAVEVQERHVVMLIPFEMVSETEKGSGKYQRRTKAPIFVPDSGIGRGVTFTPSKDVYMFQTSINLSNSAVDVLTVSLANLHGTYTGTLTETGLLTGIFQSEDGAVIATLSPVIQTTDSTIENLILTVTAPIIHLNNEVLTVCETEASSKTFKQPELDVTIDLVGGLTSQPDQIKVTITSEQSHGFDLLETGNDTKVFVNAESGLTVSLASLGTLNSSTKDILHATLSGSSLPSKATYILEEKTNDAKIFSNFTQSSTNITPVNPSQTHDGVFYIRMGKMGNGNIFPSIKVKVDGGDVVEVQMNAVPNDARSMLSEPLLLVQSSITESYSGLKTLHATAGASTILTTSIFGAAIAKTNGVLPAFLGAALESNDFRAASQTTGDHWDILDRIIGRKTNTYWGMSSTPARLGYPNSTVDKEVTNADLSEALPKHSIFYIMAHGLASNEIQSDSVLFQGIVLWEEKMGFDTRDHNLTAQEITDHIGENEYNLVYINACGAGNDSAGVATAYAQAFKAKNYVSWNFPVTITSARGAAEQFFVRLDNGAKVSDALRGIQAARSSAKLGTIGSPSGLGQTGLKQITRDDEVIIDMTPDPLSP